MMIEQDNKLIDKFLKENGLRDEGVLDEKDFQEWLKFRDENGDFDDDAFTKWEIEQDLKKFNEFIKNKSYPSFNEVMKIIEEDREDVIHMFAEYGEKNHQCMNNIFENPLDKEIVRNNGKKINKRGGKTAMVWNFYTLAILKHRSKQPDMEREDIISVHDNFKDAVSKYWDGVGDWRH